MAVRSITRTRGGNIVALTAISLTILLAFAAMAIDGQRAYMVHGELRNAAEATAHAAALGLDGTTAGYDAAYLRASQIAEANQAAGLPINLDEMGGDPYAVELGRYEDGEFVADLSDPSLVKAVRVNLRLQGMNSFFGRPAFGVDEMAVSTQVRALGGGPANAKCPLPIAVPSCALPRNAEGTLCDMDIIFGPDNNDNGAWARLGAGSPNAAWVRDSIQSCASASSTVDTVSLNNGQITTASKALADAVDASSARWDTVGWGTMPAQRSNSAIRTYGKVLESQIIIVESPSGCANPKLTGSNYSIQGFATAIVYDVVATGKAVDRTISMRVMCDNVTTQAGGGFYGTKAPPQFF